MSKGMAVEGMLKRLTRKGREEQSKGCGKSARPEWRVAWGGRQADCLGPAGDSHKN